MIGTNCFACRRRRDACVLHVHDATCSAASVVVFPPSQVSSSSSRFLPVTFPGIEKTSQCQTCRSAHVIDRPTDRPIDRQAERRTDGWGLLLRCGSCRLFDARHACRTVPACLPYGFARRDGLLTQSQCRHFPWHFRGGTIQLFANGENEYSKGRRVVYALIIGNEARSAQKVPRRKGTDFHSVSKWR